MMAQVNRVHTLLLLISLTCARSSYAVLSAEGKHKAAIGSNLKSKDFLKEANSRTFWQKWAGPYFHDVGGSDLKQPDTPHIQDVPPQQFNRPSSHPPILILPPLTGVEIQGKLDKPGHTPHFWCPSQSDWRTLWIDPEIFLPGGFSCVAENLRTVLNQYTNRSESLPGVTTRTNDEWQTSAGAGRLNPLRALHDKLQQMEWTPNRNLAYWTYDWRLAPSDWVTSDTAGGWIALKKQIETMVARSGGQPLVAIGLSMGSPYFSTFLSSSGLVDAEWKARNVAALISVSGVFAGTTMAPYDIISGRLEGIERWFAKEDVRPLMHSVPALSWLAPQPEAFGDMEILSSSYGRTSYTATDMGRAFKAAKAYQAAAYWELNRQYSPEKPPGVRVVCLYSRGLPTLSSVKYSRRDLSDDSPRVSYTDGDMTVPTRSLAVCEQWKDVPDHPLVTSRVWWEVAHAGILNLQSGIDYVVGNILALSSPQFSATQ